MEGTDSTDKPTATPSNKLWRTFDVLSYPTGAAERGSPGSDECLPRVLLAILHLDNAGTTCDSSKEYFDPVSCFGFPQAKTPSCRCTRSTLWCAQLVSECAHLFARLHGPSASQQAARERGRMPRHRWVLAVVRVPSRGIMGEGGACGAVRPGDGPAHSSAAGASCFFINIGELVSRYVAGLSAMANTVVTEAR